MPTDDRDTDRESTGFIRAVLSGLVETIADMDERDERRRTETGTAHGDTARFDYGFSVGIGPQTDGRDRAEPVAAAETDHTTTVQSVDDGCVVTLDLPDVTPRELSAGVDGSARALVVADDGGVIERVALPRGDLEVRGASYNNGVLDVHLRRTPHD